MDNSASDARAVFYIGAYLLLPNPDMSISGVFL